MTSSTAKSSEVSPPPVPEPLARLDEYDEFLCDLWRLRDAQKNWDANRGPRTMAMKRDLENRVDQWITAADERLHFTRHLQPHEIAEITIPY